MLSSYGLGFLLDEALAPSNTEVATRTGIKYIYTHTHFHYLIGYPLLRTFMSLVKAELIILAPKKLNSEWLIFNKGKRNWPFILLTT